MKNIIPITTLLVAGATFANAALSSETSWENVPSSAVSGSDIATWTTNDSALVWKNAWSIALTIDKNALSTSNLTLLAMSPNSKHATNQKNFDGFTGITYDYNSSGSTLSIEFFGTTGTASSAFSSLSATENLTFVLSKTTPVDIYSNGKLYSNLVLNVYGDENFETALTSVTISNISSDYTTHSGTLLEFGGLKGLYTSGAQTNAGFYSNNTGAFTLKAASYWTGGNVDSTALSAYYAAIIPEPSAFGLLAGVGALALVAARRRRSKKV